MRVKQVSVPLLVTSGGTVRKHASPSPALLDHLASDPRLLESLDWTLHTNNDWDIELNEAFRRTRCDIRSKHPPNSLNYHPHNPNPLGIKPDNQKKKRDKRNHILTPRPTSGFHVPAVRRRDLFYAKLEDQRAAALGQV